ncbi:uncharacterized protein LOC128545979 isoform X1 [Mercenaria mercenaria]|uniref:uncharacterized protein LOC128545979 isoform X1 n=2 Tax=Mercenaria mercenaria TaxID=6596 RepID=UPI00234F0295|nr:uncharacterized protein LOC128545979 isoform X1 [Mercenaria mercenaria]
MDSTQLSIAVLLLNNENKTQRKLAMGMFDFTIENSTLPSILPWKFGQDYWCSFELYPERTGKTFYIFRGMAYHNKDYWSGTMVAVKTFRHLEGTVSDWMSYKERCDVTRKLVADFNKHLASVTCDTKLTFIKPIDAVMDSISDVMKITRFFMRYDKKFENNEVVLFEEFLEGDFKIFVDAHGSATENGSEVLDAFCHFTYHVSKENLVVCNLKGIEEEGEYKLTNPTVHSREGCYGDKDKRDVGISDFFCNHICNSLCENFIKPDTLHVQECYEEPCAPNHCCTSDDTISKERETEEGMSFMEQKNNERGQILLPEYTSSDPLGPPSYDTCINGK